MFMRLPYLSLIVSLAAALAAVPAMATDEVPAPPAPPAQGVPPAQVSPPATGGLGACTDSSRPSSRISTSSARAGRRGVVRGTASDRGCGASGRGSVARVTISVVRKHGKRCRYMSSGGRLGRAKSCSAPTWLTAHGSSRWSFGLPKKLPRGAYKIHVRAVDSAANVGLQRSLSVRVR
jgi:hypothetical protein